MVNAIRLSVSGSKFLSRPRTQEYVTKDSRVRVCVSVCVSRFRLAYLNTDTDGETHPDPEKCEVGRATLGQEG